MADGDVRTIVQVNYKLETSRAEYDQATLASADKLAATPGLLWKVWIVNEAASLITRGPIGRPAPVTTT